MEEKEKKRELLKGSRHKIKKNFINREALVTVLVLGFYSQTPFTKYQKKPKAKAITRDKLGRNKKNVTKRSKRQKSRNVNTA